MPLERDAQRQPEIARCPFGVRAARGRAGDGHKIPQRANRAVVVEAQVRYVRARIRKMRSVAQVEGLGTDLQFPALAHAEVAEESRVYVGHSGATQDIQPRIVE